MSDATDALRTLAAELYDEWTDWSPTEAHAHGDEVAQAADDIDHLKSKNARLQIEVQDRGRRIADLELTHFDDMTQIARLELEGADDLNHLATENRILCESLAAAQAVIEQAPHDERCSTSDYLPEPCDCWKSQSSSSALAAHDAEVAAKALALTDAQVEAAAQAIFEGPDDGDWSWEDVVREEPSRADIWRGDARRVLGAARAQALRDGQETT